jgi:protein involved in polysaccharide export with SLBB domain
MSVFSHARNIEEAAMTESNRNTTLGLGFWRLAKLTSGFLVALLVNGLVVAVPAQPQSGYQYQLGPNDVLRVQVFGEEDLTVESKVGGDGAINFPLLGSVPIAGKTVKELQEYLVGRLAEGYVRSPKVMVLLVRYRNFYVHGEVKTPGGYPYEAGLTVQKAISLAGGFTEKAETRKITATRVLGDRANTVVLGMEAPILPDDILAVAPMQKFFVSGEVRTPGRYPYEPGLTVQKALSMAGGLTERADPAGIKLTRFKEVGVETEAGTLETLVLADDMLAVEGLNQRQKFYISGEVRTPGQYFYQPGLTIQKALTMAGGFTDKADKAEVKVTRFNGKTVETMLLEADTVVMPDDLLVVVQAKKIYVNGEVRSSGAFPFEKGLTVHKAITMAGGFTDKAAKTSTRVLRSVNGEERTIDVTLNAPVLPEDIIVVPQRFF